ncbi:MAG TPA: hypothetical protein VMC81_05840 [Rhodocyclaceae bacterium]|nr:hypothetical protein [Rhodocyclaceae bacterium]
MRLAFAAAALVLATSAFALPEPPRPPRPPMLPAPPAPPILVPGDPAYEPAPVVRRPHPHHPRAHARVPPRPVVAAPPPRHHGKGSKAHGPDRR